MKSENASISRPAEEVRSALFAWTTASVLGLCVVASGFVSSTPLPIFLWAAAFLFIAVASDVQFHRVPNFLTIPAFLFALAAAPLLGASAGLADSLAGGALGFALLIAPYALGGVGAGDVKALAALGAWVGAETILGTTSWALMAAGIFGIVSLALRGELRGYFKRWTRIVVVTATLRKNSYEPPTPGSFAATGIPFAAALAVGLAVQLYGGTPW